MERLITTTAALEERAMLLAGHDYSRASVGYITDLPGVREPRGALLTNCCVFVEDVLVGAFNPAEWGGELHRLAMIQTSDKYGPITAAVRAGMATLLDPPISADLPSSWSGPGWCLAQGWRPDGGGHTFFVRDSSHVLEANVGLGVGYRGVGSLRTLGSASRPAATGGWGWSRIRRVYRSGLRVARLHVVG